MNNPLKRLLSLAMAVVLVMTCGVMPVFADEGESGEHTHVWADGSCECGAFCDHAGAVVTETAPTCTEPGAKTSTCSTCGNISTETIPATGHTYVEGVCTCGAEEEPAQTDLTDEGEGEEEGGEAPDTHTCDFTEEVSNTATCTEAGVKTMKCACGETQEVESPAKGHAYGDGTVTTEPTCTTEGVLTKTCGCGETTTEAIEMLAHSYVDGKCACGELDYDFDWCTALGCTEEAHHAECPFGPCTLTAGCELVKNHPGECTGMDTFDGVIDTEDELRTALETGGEIKLGNNIELTEKLDINHETTIDLNNYEITTAQKNMFYVNANTTIKGGKLTNINSVGRCVNTRAVVALTLNDVELTATASGNTQPVTIGGNANGATLNMSGCNVNAGNSGYSIYICVNSTINISGSTLTGYGNIYTTSGDGYSAEGSNITVTGSSLISNNVHSGESNAFSSIVLQVPANVTVTAGSITINTTNNEQFVIGGGLNSQSVSGATVNISSDTAITLTGDAGAKYIGVYAAKNTIRMPGANAEQLQSEGYKLVDGIVTEIIDDEGALLRAVAKGGTITLEGDITLTETLTIPAGKTVTLNLAGHTISQEKACTASYSMIENNGTLTITGNGKLSFKDTGTGDSSFGWGSYTVRNNGTLIVENGTIEHLGQQNTSSSVKHMYCAIYQYAGSTTIKDGTISTPTYRSARLWKGSMTIDGGTFDGQLWVQPVDNTAKLTINNGTFGPNGPDGSSIFVTNDTYTVDVSITGGNFTTKIGASNKDTAFAGNITGGTFKNADGTVFDVSSYVPVTHKQDTSTGTVSVKTEDEKVGTEAGSVTVDTTPTTNTTTVSTTDLDKIAQNDATEADEVTNSLSNALNKESTETLIQDMNTAGADKIVLNLDIDVETLVVTASNNVKITYDVTPVLTSVQEVENGEDTVLDTKELHDHIFDEKITFNLPLPGGTTAKFVNVWHEDTFLGAYEVKGEDDSKYITLESDSFSDWAVELLPASVDTLNAEIGTVKYPTLEAALADANSGDTIKLLDDITLDNVELIVPAGVTIDGNGKKITFTSIYNGTYDAAFGSDGSYTVKNLTVELTGTVDHSAFNMQNGGMLENVTVNNNFRRGVYVGDGNVEVKNCTFNNNQTDDSCGVYSDTTSDGKATVTSSTFNSTRAAMLYTEAVMTGNTVNSPKGISVATSDAQITNNTFTGTRALSISTSGSAITGNSFSTTTKVETKVDADLSNNYWGSENGPSASQIKTEDNATVTVNSYYTDDDMKQDDLAPGDDARAICNGVYYSTVSGTPGDPIQLVKGNSFTETLSRDVSINALGLNGSLGVSLKEGDIVTVKSSGEVVITPTNEIDGYNAFMSLKYGKDSIDAQVIFAEPGTTLSITSTTSEFDDAAFSGEFMKDLNYKDGLDKGDFKAYFPTYDNRYVKGTDETLIVESTGFFNTCLQIFVDDIEVYDAADEYEKSGVDVKVGCTRLELTSKFLKTLSTGDYTVTFVHKPGNETFEVKETIKIRDDSSKADPTNPKTGDFIMMPMAIMTLSAAALAVLLIGKKKHA